MTDHEPGTLLWDAVALSKGWLDEHNGCGDHEVTLRILKVMEEAGEVAAARIGSLGQNPRKRVSHTDADTASELADVMITAAVAIESLGLSARQVLDATCRKVLARIGQATVSPDRP